MTQHREPIAIIGIGCRFPGAKNPKAFWQMLRDGVDAITEVPQTRWDIETFYDPDTGKPDKMNTRWGGFLEQVDQFDPQFFGIAPREAASMDPQQRLLLELSWEALEDAGLIPESLANTKTGVFIGISSYDYYELLMRNPINLDVYGATGNNNCIAAHRISYVFNFTGPSMAIDTACSSSLVAVHLACQSLWNGESTLALVGGVHIMLSPWVSVSFAKGGFLAPDGRCKAFDARANGYVRSEGAGVVVLKPLSQAMASGDPIYAVIRGSAVNQDGRSNGLTAPNPRAQEAVLRQAYQLSGVSPGQVQYIEAHGTGTKLGDPMEMKALGAVLAEGRVPGNDCAVGSVKTNIGHLEAAAGIAGLIKVALSLKYRQIPPNLHFQEPNPYIPFDQLPLRVQQTLSPWWSGTSPVLAGVSSFGFGGTNAHVVLEEAPSGGVRGVGGEFTPSLLTRPRHLLTLSGKSENALRELAQCYEEFLTTHPTVSIADVCFTANTRRSHFNHRLAVVADTNTQLQAQLGAFALGKETSGLMRGKVESRKRPKIVFLFTGQGSQYVGMGRQLYETQPTFRKILDEANEILRLDLEQPLLSVLYPEPGMNSPLDETAYTQPALFALEYALAELWRSWGIVPDAVMGHSLGEYVAACVAGVFSLEDGLKLVAKRSRLMQSLPPDGQMAVVFADWERVNNTLARYEERVAIAAINGQENIVISGAKEAVESALEQFRHSGIAGQRLRVSHAFHSPLIDPILDEFENLAAKVQFQAPRIALISNLTGQMLDPGEIPFANYWRRHTRSPVQFLQGLHSLTEQGYDLFVELGPQPTLLGMGKRCLLEGIDTWLPSLKKDQDDWQVLLNSVGALYVKGVDVDWAGFDQDYAPCLISLPTYPWQTERYWFEESPVEQPRTKSQELSLWESLVTAGQQQSQQGPLDLAIHTQSDKLRCLDNLTTAYIISALQKLGIYTQAGKRHSADTLLEQFNISSIYRKLLCRWLERLAQEGMLQQVEEDFVSPQQLPEVLTNAMIGEARKKWPGASHVLDFIERCGENLADVLVGKVNPVDLLFPGGAFETAEGIYQHAPEARYFNSIAKSILESVVKNLSQDRPLRILEIGAGTGGTTAALLPVLPVERTLYYYTDLSEVFLARAKQKFKTYPFVRYHLLNIEENPTEQSLEAHSFDVVVAANILHATNNLGKTLDNIKSLLVTNGVLLIWELTHPQSWLDITFALFDGWQRFNDQLRQDSPLMSREQWEMVLRLHGFEEVAAFPKSGSAAEVLSQHVLVAQAPASIPPQEGLVSPKTDVLENPNNWLYELKWQPKARLEGQRDSPSVGQGTWLIFADTSGIGKQLADLLAQKGERSVLVFPSEAYECIDEGQFHIHPERPEDIRQMLKIALEANTLAFRGIVHLWSLNVPLTEESTVASLERMQSLGCSSVLHLIQELEQAGWGETGRLWLVTQGSQMLEEKPLPLVAVAQAPLWGLGRTICQEHNALWGGLVDLDPQALVDDASTWLWQEIWNSDGEDQLAFRQGQRYVARLVRKHESTLQGTPVVWRSDGSYLITGGLGDLGLLVARWMVVQGAKRLILLGRTPLSDRTTWDQVEKGSRLADKIAAIRELESLGASVYLASVDVASEEQLNSFIEAFYRSGWPPIRGVVHAAGLAQDRTLLQLDRDALNAVLQPKVVGGWLLHRLLENAPLDFFVLFSSMSSLLAQPGQGNYAAANAFCDALAHYRRSLGLPALSINWGVWAELGLATTFGGRRLAEHLARLGIRSLESKQGLELLGRLLGQNSAQVAIMPVNWSALRDFYPTARKLSLLSDLLRESVHILPEADSLKGFGRLTQDVLKAAEPVSAKWLLESYVSEHVARVLGLATSLLDVQQPLNNLGLDSLMAVELNHQIEGDLGIVVPVANFLEGYSVAQLTTQILEQLTTTTASTQELSSVVDFEYKDIWLSAIAQENTEHLLANLEQLKDEEVDSLLKNMLAEEEV